jgi:hypothetical protein
MWVGSGVAPYYTRPNSADKITNTYRNRLYLIRLSPIRFLFSCSDTGNFYFSLCKGMSGKAVTSICIQNPYVAYALLYPGHY